MIHDEPTQCDLDSWNFDCRTSAILEGSHLQGQTLSPLNDFGVSIPLFRKTSELRDTSDEQIFPRHVSVLEIKIGLENP